MQLQSIVDWFIPDGIDKNDDLHIRLNQLILFCFIACPIFFIPNIIKWKNLGSVRLAVSMTFVTIFIAACPFIVKYTKSISLFSNFAFSVLSWHFFFLCFCTGGIYSSAMTWNLVIPVFAAAFGSTRSSFVWTGIILLEVGLFVYFDVTGYPLSAISFTKEQFFEVQTANVIGPLLALAMTMYFAEKSRQNAYDAQSMAREQALLTEKKTKEKTDQYATHLQEIFVEIDAHSQNLNSEIEDITAKIKENAQHSETADNIMKKSDAMVMEAQESMKQLTASMEKIAAASENTSKILKTIDEIAFQTNLALNASRCGICSCGG